MKYVKLFENWLNEADEAKPATFDSEKPFDFSKPNETAIVDITGKEVGNDPLQVQKVIETTINRIKGKRDEPGFDIDGFVGRFKYAIPCRIISKEPKKEGIKVTSFLVEDLTTGMQCRLLMEDLLNNELLKEYIKTKTPLFVLTSSKFKPAKETSMITVKPDNCVLIPTAEDKGLSFDKLGEKSFLEHNFYQADSNSSKLENPQPLLNILPKLSGLPDAEVKNLAGIAELVGYKIPQNYAPKQGGIEFISK